jgi:cytosine/adenosine deaminase-related metal-dependent hydrolase
VPGLADVHVHFMPQRLLRRVWEYFDAAGLLVGTSWPIRYRWPQEQRVAHLRKLGVRMFSALSYAHRPGMAAWLSAWSPRAGTREWRARTPATSPGWPGTPGRRLRPT